MNPTITEPEPGQVPIAPPSLPSILVVAPSMRIMGGQAVMAEQLLKDMRSAGADMGFQPINPKLPGVLQLAEHVKGLRTLVISTFYVVGLFRQVPRYDVIHIFSASYLSFIISQTPAILIAKFYGKKIVLNYHSGQCDDHLNRWGRVVYAILSMVDEIVVQTQYLVNVFAKHGFESRAIANVIDVHAFPFRPRDPVTAKIIVPRMLEPLYNVECAIRAFAIVKQQYRDAEMTLLGTGSQERDLKALVDELGLSNVTFAGRVEREQIAVAYDRHDIFLNSSSIDNMPISILEAFAMGLPVVSTAAGGIPYMVTNGKTGYLAPLNDHEGLANNLLKVLQEPKETARLVNNARHDLQKYRWESVAEQWFDLYSKLTETNSENA